MARLDHFEVSGYRSIGDEVCLRIPSSKPLVIVGENNAGKSNLVRSIERLLGEGWPPSWAPEDHDFYGRDTTGEIRISARATGLSLKGRDVEGMTLSVLNGFAELNWHFDNDASSWPNQDARSQLQAVVINADRRLSYQLSYASRWTMLSKLMRRFHRVLTDDESRRAALEAHYEALHRIFDDVPEYAAFVARLQSEVGQLGGNMPYGLEIDFSAYDPSNFFHGLRVMPSHAGERMTYEELGTGQEQVLALGFAYAYASAFAATGAGLILVIEEPEAHLHPLAQDWLSAQLHRFTGEGVQVIITTHSPSFVDIRNLDALVLVRKNEEGTYATQLSRRDLTKYCIAKHASREKTEPATILEYYDVGATPELRSGFFARGIVLVEGPTEAYAIPELLRQCGLDLTAHGVACIPVGGKGNLAKWWRLFNAYQIPVYVIFDNDARDDSTSTKRSDILETLGVPEAERSNWLGTTELAFANGFAVMGRDLEHVLRTELADYAELESSCNTDFGYPGKPFVARWVIENLEAPSSDQLVRLASEVASALQLRPIA